MLAFRGHNFYRGIVQNENLGFQKDVVYDLLENPRYNWRQFLFKLVIKIISVLELLTNEVANSLRICRLSAWQRI